MKTSTRRAIVALLAVSVLATACGGDDDATDEPTTPQTGAETEQPTESAGGDEFTTAASGICGETKGAVFAAMGPVFESEGEPDPEVVTTAATTAVAALQDASDQLRALTPPAGDEESVGAWLDAHDAEVAAFDAIKDDPAAVGEALQGDFMTESRGMADAYGLTACGTGETFMQAEFDAETQAAAIAVPVDLVDYGFEGVSDELTAGPYTFQLSNAGGEDHEMVVVKTSKSLDEVIAALEADPEDQSFVEEFLGGGYAGPKGATDVNLDLQAGSYIYVCFIPAADGTPHLFKGMAGELTVS